MTDRGPTIDEETQQEPPPETHPPVSVAVVGPVRTQDLPGTVTAVRTVNLPSDNSSVNVANADLRRKSIIILSTDQPFVFGVTKSDVDGTAGARWPINVPLIISGTALLYAKSGTNATAATLSVVEVDWTE